MRNDHVHNHGTAHVDEVVEALGVSKQAILIRETPHFFSDVSEKRKREKTNMEKTPKKKGVAKQRDGANDDKLPKDEARQGEQTLAKGAT